MSWWRMARGGWSGNPRVQGRVLALLLLTAGAPGLLLGIRYWRSAVEHRATAAEAVRMRAGILAMQLASSAQAHLYTAVEAQLAALGDAWAPNALDRLIAVDDSLARCRCGPTLYAERVLRYDVRRGIVDERAVRGARSGTARAQVVRDRLAEGSQPQNDRYAYWGGQADGPWLLFVRRLVRGPDTLILGVEAGLDSLRTQWNWIAAAVAVPGTPPESATAVVTMELRLPDSTLLFRRGPVRDGPAALATPGWAPLLATVVVNPAAAGRFVPGGLPHLPVQSLIVVGLAGAAVIGLGLLFNARAQALAAARAEFTAGVSHELRTPLTQILLFAETLQLDRAGSAEDRRSAAQAIVRESRRLLSMIENVLRVATAERSQVSFAVRAQPLAPLVTDIVRLAGPLAAAEGSRVELFLRDAPTAQVDETAVRQILGNLLDNAIRHGPPGQTIRVELAARDGMAQVRVEDQGAGIPAGDRTRIFEPYVRLDAPARRSAGVGLGLAVVRHLTGLLGGRVWVETAPGGGSAFVVALQLDSGETPP